jgi:hypothetical protein
LRPPHRSELIRTQIDQLDDIAPRDPENPFNTIINVHEAASLAPIAPDFDLVWRPFNRMNNLSIS